MIDIQRLNPLTHDELEAMFNVKISKLTREEIIEKYDDILSDEQRKALEL